MDKTDSLRNLSGEAIQDMNSKTAASSFPTIVIDGVFFQLNQTGIARLWRALLEEWSQSGFAAHLVVLDRGYTTPKIEGIEYRSWELYDYRFTELDCQRLQEICDQVRADVFISSYYTTPLTTPSVFMAYDMVPEAMGLNLEERCWQEKHLGILAACRYIAISQNTAEDLQRFFPFIAPELITVAYCGVSHEFSPASNAERQSFRSKYQIEKPYFLLVGSRLSLKGYKNGCLFFQALQELVNAQDYAVLCVGGEPQLEPELAIYEEGIDIHLLSLEDNDLRVAYANAIALIYPSRYEGFGLPIAEAMACGCPVITCANSSIPEVAGEAALYVQEDSTEQMQQALLAVQAPELRQRLIERGWQQVQQFSWQKMAAMVAQVLSETAQTYHNRPIAQVPLLWQSLRQQQSKMREMQSLYHSTVEQVQSLENEVAQLRQENQKLSSSLADLNQRFLSLWTLKRAIKKRAKVLLHKLISMY